MPREQIGGGRRQWKTQKNKHVVRGDRASDAGQERTSHVGDRLRVHPDGEGALELLHHGERIVMASDNLHAEYPLGWRADHGRRHHHRDGRSRG
jgi:hypothetical protein